MPVYFFVKSLHTNIANPMSLDRKELLRDMNHR